MKKSLSLVIIDTEYCNYLRKYDEKVPYNYNEKQLRPFVGVLFEVNDCMYFAPLSSPKPKHLKLKNKLDFLKIDSGKLGAINFNNMLPVSAANVVMLDLNKECLTETEEKYTKLLQEQIYWLNRNSKKILGRAKKLYDRYLSGKLDEKIAKRCCDFKLLEEKCQEYKEFLSTKDK